MVWGGVSESDLMPSGIYTAAELAQSIYNMEENLVKGWQGDKKGLKQFDKLTASSGRHELTMYTHASDSAPMQASCGHLQY